MLKSTPIFLFILIASCTNRQDKQAAVLSRIDSFLVPKVQVSKIPDSMASKMHDFAMEFPQNPKSELYLYTATQVSENAGRFFETAKWCEDYVTKFPKGKYRLGAITAAGANFEKCGSFEKAIEFYEKLSKEFPTSPLAKDAQRNVTMLKMGLTTPEQQLEYLIKQNDTANTINQ